jgi:hypothetical protein
MKDKTGRRVWILFPCKPVTTEQRPTDRDTNWALDYTRPFPQRAKWPKNLNHEVPSYLAKSVYFLTWRKHFKAYENIRPANYVLIATSSKQRLICGGRFIYKIIKPTFFRSPISISVTSCTCLYACIHTRNVQYSTVQYSTEDFNQNG